jgi:hypothetical protein
MSVVEISPYDLGEGEPRSTRLSAQMSRLRTLMRPYLGEKQTYVTRTVVLPQLQ